MPRVICFDGTQRLGDLAHNLREQRHDLCNGNAVKLGCNFINCLVLETNTHKNCLL